jgi:tetratricopeptide (TPR) repeat protein
VEGNRPAGDVIDPKDRIELFDLLNLGHILMGPARALAKTEELRARHGSLPALDRFELGMLDSLGRSRDALEVLERLAGRSGGDADAYAEQLAARRAAYRKQEQLAGAIRRAMADGSAPPSAEADLALTLHRLQSWPEAEKHYRAALARSPRQADLRKNLVRLLMGADRPEEALAIAEEGRALDPMNATLSCLAGRILAIHLRRGREAEAAYADCRSQGGQPSVYEIEVLSLLRAGG